LSIRLKHASKLLEETDFPVAEIAAKVGFDLPHYFTRLFTDKIGCSPKQHRDAHKKATC
jgi:transcriptional regulator GlxA family with amidase domain